MLGKETARRLVIESPFLGLPTKYWWDLLDRLPGIKELELYPVSVTALSLAQRVMAPAVLPFLRRVQPEIMPSGQARSNMAPHQYDISGNTLTRRIVRLSSHSEVKIASSGGCGYGRGDQGDVKELLSCCKVSVIRNTSMTGESFSD